MKALTRLSNSDGKCNGMKHTAISRISLGVGAVLCGLSGLSGLRAQGTGSVDVSGYPRDAQKQYTVFAAKCSRCHDLNRALTARYTTPAQWKDLVERMARRPGAGISPRDRAAITSFLVFHQQARAGSAAPRAATAGSGTTRAAGDVSSYPADVQKQYRVFAEKCSRCHDLTRGLTARYTGPAQWKDLVERMARRPGAGISPRDRATITSFLVYHERARGGAPSAPSDGADAPPASPAPGNAQGSTVEGGMRVEVEALPAQSIDTLADGKWVTESPAEGENLFLVVRLYDERMREKVPYATVRARLSDDGGAVPKTLRPLFGPNGFYYGRNFAAPSGDLAVTVSVEPPALGRVHEESDRWPAPVEFKLTVRGRS
jgi:cytochrome c2